ncbi:divergent polysaccharide deacetylase family protein [Desulfobulbus rhabdoformis]|uniref:divergent polysaccharide deacetylase family protein n=1 Tax=Desulfobulbus rhabdoformis TaxID=34032 RepID=UPI0019630AF1|nr:divergent polysaccharide deacetylase family protein [Desulfobulbus rhabdoformis]
MLVRFFFRAFLFITAVLVLLLAPVRLAVPPAPPWHIAQKASTLRQTGSPGIRIHDQRVAELLPQGEPQKSSPPASTQPVDQISRPKVALIIDDMGYNKRIGLKLLRLQLPLNFSFLPQAPHTQELLHLAQQMDRTILVHMPMEPQSDKWKAEPVTLYTKDSQEELERKVEQMLEAVPQARGANNHMGSRFTREQKKMAIVLGIVQQHHLFFVDSYTTGNSLGLSSARRMGIPTAKRNIFLDNEQNVDAICKRLGQVAELAREKKNAIAIGHPNQAMVTALASCAQEKLNEVELVSVEELLR